MTARDAGQPHILHIHSRFPVGDSARRSRQVAEALGGSATHSLVVVEVAKAATAPFRKADRFPKITGLPTLGRLQRIARAMLGYDLVCTYDYGAMHAVMAHTAFSHTFELPPLIHQKITSRHKQHNLSADRQQQMPDRFRKAHIRLPQFHCRKNIQTSLS